MSERLVENHEAEIPFTIEEVYKEISSMEPKPVAAFVPKDGDEQKKLFLNGKIRNPSHEYNRLEKLNPEIESSRIRELASHLPEIVDENSIDFIAYSEYANRYVKIHELLQASRDIHSADEVISSSAKKRFMELNVELYGEPDETIYRSLIHEAIRKIDDKNLSVGMLDIKSELTELLPSGQAESNRFVPSRETILNMQNVAEYLYGGMFEHIPQDQESFNPQDIADVFTDIIEAEFGESAEGWKVIVTKAASINVVAGDKVIKIPENRKAISQLELRGLVAHEIGVHMLRSVTGGETNLPILKTGLSEYYDSEEGLGKVMEQAVTGKYAESGAPYYMVAGLIYFDEKDFRETYEIMWRINYLESCTEGEEVTEEEISATREATYKSILRITRGTDKCPWFKDLAYYNGTSKMWQYCEQASQDPEKFMLLLMGKSDITNDTHRRIMLETKSI